MRGVDGLIELLEQGPSSGIELALGASNSYLRREYVWGTGTSRADELIALYDRQWPGEDGSGENWQPWFVLQDLDGDNVALVDVRGGPDGQGGWSSTPRVSAQWNYDPYGRVRGLDVRDAHPVLTTGHRGVFFDRLDVPVLSQAGDESLGDLGNIAAAVDARILIPGTHVDLIGHMRNRAYDPLWGRFLQRDMNATGQPVLADVACHGQPLAPDFSVLDVLTLYGDGPSLYAYLEAGPRGHADPSGLSEFSISGIGTTTTVRGGLGGGAVPAGVGSQGGGLGGFLGNILGNAGRNAAIKGLEDLALGARYAIQAGRQIYNIYQTFDALGFFSTTGNPIPALTGPEIIEHLKTVGAQGEQGNVRTLPESAMQPLFDKITQGGQVATPQSYADKGGTMVRMPDGTLVGFRPDSSSGGKTIDVFPPKGKNWKVHVQ